jgi:methylenetetrahydrofolate reductase (NADPH)
MKIKDMFLKTRPTISFEVFPPKSTYSLDSIFKTIDELKDLDPDFISVTYGAGGSEANLTTEIASRIKNEYNIESIAHLTCITSDRESIIKNLADLKANNIENILALRGDVPAGYDKPFHYQNAVQLIEEIKRFDDFSIGGAAYPEGHLEAINHVSDLKYLKTKVDCGLDFLITQLFFDNEIFYQFKEKLELLNIDIPVIAGIFPVVNLNQIRRVQEMTQSHLPKKFLNIINRYEHNPEALKEAGIAYATDQIIDLLSSGVDGIHIYTMNKPNNTRKIMESIKTIRSALNNPSEKV